jgi:hypothetical protein
MVGLFETGAANAAPPALWPVLAREMSMHPALPSELVKSGRAPKRVEVSFRIAGTDKDRLWRLVSAEPIAAPYPLTETLTNATAAWINEAVAVGLGDLAAEGGPPTLARWDAQVGRVAKEKGAAAAVFAMWPALNMFPQVVQTCQSGPTCSGRRRTRGLPTDAKALHVRAIQAYPYNPAYWTDLGDLFVRRYDMWTAYALYDVAFSLPMPDAQRANVTLAGKRRLAARIRADFPAFFLGK